MMSSTDSPASSRGSAIYTCNINMVLGTHKDTILTELLSYAKIRNHQKSKAAKAASNHADTIIFRITTTTLFTLVSTSSSRSRYSLDCERLAPICSSALTMLRSLLALLPLDSSRANSALPMRCRTELQPTSSASPAITLRISRRFAINCDREVRR